MLKIYNSQKKTKEEFVPLQPGKVNMYVCGMTVYDYCHIGHARVMISFDMVAAYLRFIGYDVNYVRNITDIDDKIIVRANENNEEFHALTERFIQAMHEDEKALGNGVPSLQPKATEHIDEIIALIQGLVEKNKAYVGANGDVYFGVRDFSEYGKLSHRNLDDLRAGERVDVAEDKRDPLDFVLWKMAKPDEPSWESPWGKGRPGWHIECSAMSMTCLGEQLDIHGGGMDLLFPHHENEVAQSEASTGKTFVNTWMHVGYLQVNEEKMSKSLGNFFTIREVLEKYSAEVVRFFMLSSHYRSPLNYSASALDNAKNALVTLYTALRGLPEVEADMTDPAVAKFNEAMSDDFNTPEAIAVLFELAHEVNRQRSSDATAAAHIAAVLRKLAGVFNLLQQSADAFLKHGVVAGDSGMSDTDVDKLIADREAARAAKQWEAADNIRDQLLAQNIVLEDTADGVLWRRK